MLRKELIANLKRLGLSQKDFADMIGYSHQTVKQWEDGKIPKWVKIILDYFDQLQKDKKLAEEYGIHAKE